MSDMQPTADGGASVIEQLEGFLAAGEEKKPEAESGQEAAHEKPEATEAEETASDEQAEEDGPQLSISDVAKILGVDESNLDVDEDGTLKVKTKIDGKEGAAKFHDLVKSYQLQGHVDAKVRQAAEQEKAIAERVQAIEQFAQVGMQRLDALSTAAQQMLMAEFQSTNWDQLVKEDPITYTEKRHQFEARQAQLGQLMQHVEQQRAQFQNAYQWKEMQALQSEAQKIPTLIPEWADESVANTEKQELAKWMLSNGVKPETIGANGAKGITDAALMALLVKGYRADKAAPKVAAVEKKVRAAPKLVKPGQSTTAGDRQDATVRGLKDQIRKSGGKNGIAEYLIATGRV